MVPSQVLWCRLSSPRTMNPVGCGPVQASPCASHPRARVFMLLLCVLSLETLIMVIGCELVDILIAEMSLDICAPVGVLMLVLSSITERIRFWLSVFLFDGYMTFQYRLARVRLRWSVYGSWRAISSHFLRFTFASRSCWAASEFPRFCCHIRCGFY